MVTTKPGQIPRTHPTDDAVSNYGIELNHADDSGTGRPFRQLRSTPARTNEPAIDAERSLISLKLARSSETQLRSPYRGKFASCLTMPETTWRHANRGPPGTGPSGNSRRPHGAHSKTQTLGTSWIKKKRGRKKRDRGLGPQSSPPQSPLQGPRYRPCS